MTLCQRCASPALTGQSLCYFHNRQSGRNPNRSTPANLEATLDLPALADPTAILLALSQLVQSIALNQIDPQRANLLLRSLTLATRLTAAIQKLANTKPTTEPGAPLQSPDSGTWVSTPAHLSPEATAIDVSPVEGDGLQPVQSTATHEPALAAEGPIPPAAAPAHRTFSPTPTSHTNDRLPRSLRDKLAARREGNR